MTLDPYSDWLKIPGDRRPPSYYDLLGLPEREADNERIQHAATERISNVRRYQVGKYSDVALRVLSELSLAFGCLTDPEAKRRYDSGLSTCKGERGEAPSLQKSVEKDDPDEIPKPLPFLGGVPLAPRPIQIPVILGPRPASKKDLPNWHDPESSSEHLKWYRPYSQAIVVLVLAGIAGAVCGYWFRRNAGVQRQPLVVKRNATDLPDMRGVAPRDLRNLAPKLTDSTIRNPSKPLQPLPSDESPTETEDQAAPAILELPPNHVDVDKQPAAVPSSANEQSSPVTVDRSEDTSLPELKTPESSERSVVSRTIAVQSAPGAPFEDVPKPRALLVGFNVVTTRFYGGEIINALQPIYSTAGRKRLDGVYGQPKGQSFAVQAKSGYAVGGIVLKSGLRIDGFRLIFMRVVSGKLKSSDSYESEWIGGLGGDKQTTLGNDGSAVVGVFGECGADVTNLGLFLFGPQKNARAD